MTRLHRAPTSPTSRSLERRRNLLVTASELFLAHGYDGVSMDAIVAAAGGDDLPAQIDKCRGFLIGSPLSPGLHALNRPSLTSAR